MVSFPERITGWVAIIYFALCSFSRNVTFASNFLTHGQICLVCLKSVSLREDMSPSLGEAEMDPSWRRLSGRPAATSLLAALHHTAVTT